MLPVMTSIQPRRELVNGRVGELVNSEARSVTTIHQLTNSPILLDPRLVFAGLRVHTNSVALVDERRHLNDEAGLEGRRLDLRAGRGALDARHRLLHDQID